MLLLAMAGCQGPHARSARSFEEINQLVAGRDAPAVVNLLGEPDTRRPLFGADEKWIWWNYTFLAGHNHPPELRGRVVHLEITLTANNNDSEHFIPTSRRVPGRLGIAYRLPEAPF